MPHDLIGVIDLRSIERATPDYGNLQRQLARFNRARIAPGLGEMPRESEISKNDALLELETAYIEKARHDIAPMVSDVPEDADAFIRWFKALRETGPGQGDTLFPWLAEEASYAQMKWFLQQEVAGEAGFDDLVALTQVKMPPRAKLEMARNYWDEMGRGNAQGMHGPMLDRLSKCLDLHPTIDNVVEEALALGNMMMGLGFNRRYAFHSVGALGAIEMTAPGRAAQVVKGLNRLGVSPKESHYFALHAVLDEKHSDAWNREVLHPLVAEDPRRARAIAEGAVLRLSCGAKCFARYREEFDLE
jgi:hypothetical protein